jgi:hypothetical protein
MKWKNELFPTVVKVDILFSSDHREMISEQILSATEQLPTVNGKMDVHYNDRREKFAFSKYKGMTAQCTIIYFGVNLTYPPE